VDVKMKRGLLYTLTILVLLIPAIMLVVFYIGLGSEGLTDEVASLRCDQMHYFVQDVRKDLVRANVIFGRRAAVYAVDYVVTEGVGLENYSFNCTELCSVNCTIYTPPPDGAESAIAELVLCGTLAGENASFMTNHTMPKWIGKIRDGGRKLNFNSSFTVWDFHVAPYDSFNFSLIMNYTLDASDFTGLCSYRGVKTRIESITPIVGLEDPLKPLNTEGRIFSQIDDCPINVSVETILGSSRRGYGNGSSAGNIIYAGNMSDPSTHCSTNDVSGKVLVVETGFGSCNQIEQMCFNASVAEEDHFAGVINFGPDNPQSFSEKCDITIPWISDTGDLNVSYGNCVAIKNREFCSIHDVLVGPQSSGLEESCYQASDVSNFESACGNPTPNGPSFFDRLDGRLNLSEKYVNQSIALYNNSIIGLESLVDLHNLRQKDLDVKENASWIDYLYWMNTTGCGSLEACAVDYPLKLDCAHALTLGVDTECDSGFNIKPTSNITSLEDGSSINCNETPLNVSGTASDCDGNVSRVEFGVDGSYTSANGTVNWSAVWQPTESKEYTLCSRAVDEKAGMQSTPYCINTQVACCGGDPALTVSFTTGFPYKNPGNNKPVRVKTSAVDENCLAVTDAQVNVTVDGEDHDPEEGTMLHNGGGVYGDGVVSYWESQTDFGNQETINITVTAMKAGYAQDSITYLIVQIT